MIFNIVIISKKFIDYIQKYYIYIVSNIIYRIKKIYFLFIKINDDIQ